MPTILITVDLRFEHDVVLTRQRARQIAALLGFEVLDQTRIATAVSELARNVIAYAQRGKVEFSVERTGNPALVVRIDDEGPGISDLRTVLDGRFISPTGIGLGIASAKRLMDHFHIESSSTAGTSIVLGKVLPKSVLERIPEHISNVLKELARRSSQNPFEEIKYQNQELLSLMEDLRARDDELQRLNQELAETNRGVVALYSELDGKAGDLLRASELKTGFLSNMSHEFRTPLASIISLTGILLDRMDGELAEEQEKQVTHIKGAAESLLRLVNDLLDIAKIEAGKTEVTPSAFHVVDLFSTLKGTFKPMLKPEGVHLAFDEPDGIPMLYTDEAKILQILRNFVSNAIKFTDCGRVTVSARATSGKEVMFSVADSGIGIAPEHQEFIFAEFTQVLGNHQKGKLGTGLGLPLCRKLAKLLGGAVSVESAPGMGSTFSATIPLVYSGPNEA